LKYGIWNVAEPEMGAVNALVSAGYSPLTSMVLSSRGIGSQQEADRYLSCDAPMPDPFLMTDMAPAAGRVSLALSRGEKIAVFGDYDVDGITATCLLTDFLRRRGRL
jgi:single-stranded-DNA-specific exonuclease